MYSNGFSLKTFFLIFCAFVSISPAQTPPTPTAFNYQARLNDGSNPANGQYDLEFRLYDALAGGAQVGSTISKPNLTLVNGVFSTQLDFGLTAFDGNNRFLEISLRRTGTQNAVPNSFSVLGPRQQILSVPYSLQAASAERSRTTGLADLALNAVNAVDAQRANSANQSDDSNKLGGTSASEYVKRNINNTGNFAVTGTINSGGGLTSAGDLAIVGNARQNFASYGLAKALIRVSSTGVVLRCYNGFTGEATGNCGFTVTQPLGNVGIVRIDFGFPVADHFVSVTPLKEGGANYIANAVFNGQFLEVYTFRSNNPDDTNPGAFMTVVF